MLVAIMLPFVGRFFIAFIAFDVIIGDLFDKTALAVFVVVATEEIRKGVIGLLLIDGLAVFLLFVVLTILLSFAEVTSNEFLLL